MIIAIKKVSKQGRYFVIKLLLILNNIPGFQAAQRSEMILGFG
jgi:hypothetical protein